MSGEWMSTVTVIKVDRKPVTREWTADPNSGTSNKNEAIWVESSDSIEFSTGFNCTAYIAEPDAAKFLYFYPSGSLAQVLDEEIRNQVQQVVAEFAAGFDLDTLRGKKTDMIADVREQVVPFFAERGITITTVGMFGGFEYKDPKIQQSINEVFVAQQEKNVEKAKLEAMDDKQKRLEAEGKAEANQAREVAKGKADAIELVKAAEAKGITLVNDALKEAKENPLFVHIKALEVESERIEKWDGSVPKMMMGSDGGGFVPMIQMSE
jgi:regulator of protease activity HflC (stomatin/prohibitin superfamily)